MDTSAEEAAQWLTAPVALTEDLDSVLSNSMVVHNSVLPTPGILSLSSRLFSHQEYMWYT